MLRDFQIDFLIRYFKDMVITFLIVVYFNLCVFRHRYIEIPTLKNEIINENNNTLIVEETDYWKGFNDGNKNNK